jgi:hypothetical protein
VSLDALDPMFIPPSPDELLAMPADIRVRYINQLMYYDEEYGTDLVGEYRKARNRCPYRDPETGAQCRDPKWPDKPHCLPHCSLEELDPKGYAESKSRQAKLRMADLLDKAVDELSALLDAPDMAPQVKLAVLTTILDRAGVPKQQSQTLDGHVEVSHSISAADVVRERIARLGDAAVARELQGIEESTRQAGEIIEGDVVDE